MANVPNGVETLNKISIAWVGRTNAADRQTTDYRVDGRTTTANVPSHCLATIRCGAHLCSVVLSRLWAFRRSVMDSRPNLLHNLPLHSRLQQYQMILFDDGCTQVWVTYPRSLRSDAQPGIKASQMRRPYHSSTTPPQAIAVTVQWGDWTSELQPRGESWQRERRRIINKVQEKAPIEHRNQIRKQASDTHDWGVLVPACRRDLVTSGLICRESQQNLTSVAGQVSFHMNALWIHRLFVYTQRSPLSLYIAT